MTARPVRNRRHRMPAETTSICKVSATVFAGAACGWPAWRNKRRRAGQAEERRQARCECRRNSNWNHDCGHVEVVTGALGPGNIVFVEVESEHVTEICTGFGEAGTPAEAVAERPAKEARRYVATGVPVGCHLADQLLPVLALGEGGSFRTMPLSRHALTNADVIREFIDLRIGTTDEGRDVTRVDVDRV